MYKKRHRYGVIDLCRPFYNLSGLDTAITECMLVSVVLALAPYIPLYI